MYNITKPTAPNSRANQFHSKGLKEAPNMQHIAYKNNIFSSIMSMFFTSSPP